MEEIQVKTVSKKYAAAMLRAAGSVDPARHATPESIAKHGQAFELENASGKGVFVVEHRGPQLWVSGAGGVKTSGLAVAGFNLVEALAGELQCNCVAFQTGRAGLVKLAKKHGYVVRGYILEKRI